jgi:hypothetical protein
MSDYHIGSINARNVVIGDQNTQVIVNDELAKVDADIERHAPQLPDVAAARRALAALRTECVARPVDAGRIVTAAGELARSTAAVPLLRDEVERLVRHIAPPDEAHR